MIDPEAALPAPVLVIGAGNFLMGDEGVGVHALRVLEQQPALDGVRLLDGGTGGINLLGELDQVKCVVFIDATRDGRPAGTLTHLRPRSFQEIPRGLSAHDFGVKDLFTTAALLGHLPELHVITLSVETLKPMCIDLSEPVAAAVPELVRRVTELAAKCAKAYAS